MQSLKMLGLAAAGAMLIFAAPVERAQAVSLINPGAAQSVQDEARPTTEVRWHRGHWRRHHWRGHRWHHRRW
ncbi:hypothetical protein [Bradyrhizobium sp. OK095]|uniref:hypothetical protein n=1 Tax=Bradyrhizobium sp. OK095 TaxID=1882760 RepID=UPI0008B88E87|nr:hypothetical protein [Bradyrhizobium sp. OK095]SEN02930.1 hypothetical protein SAMN05443254_105342 [Bradyrhizobium sp. OK095]